MNEVAVRKWIRSRPLKRALDRLAFIVFKERDPDSGEVNWLPGSGTHSGEGGQVPPYVPYNPDWDYRQEGNLYDQ
jgi:hypothetical protein